MSAPNSEAITFTACPEQTVSFTADARLNDREMQAEEPFQSRFYHAGDFHVPQDMLDQVEQECATLSESVDDIDSQSIYRPSHHRITLHAEGTSVHRAPPENYTNVNRLFYHCLFAKRVNYER